MERISSLRWKTAVLAALAGVGIGVGVGLILNANIGSDTVTVFQDGLHCQLHISYGQASRLYNLVLIAAGVSDRTELLRGRYCDFSAGHWLRD